MGPVDPLAIISKYYDPESELHGILVTHSRMVAKKALEAARAVEHLNPDLRFIEEAAMLHDIGIFRVSFPKIGCRGSSPYICHGVLGREILEREGLPRHALVCERHIGTGITRADVEKRDLPLPKRDMVPVSIEEQIICFADKFFSKDKDSLVKERSIDEIKRSLAVLGAEKVRRFEEWITIFLS
ncbi:MAG TPA: HD domain-containing protein [Desulfotomaculum sp.]|nr:HD domain-containing protein [Desulfotomaculum sp.]